MERTSSIGEISSAATAAAWLINSGVSIWPRRIASARGARMGVGATEPKASRQSAIRSPSRTRYTAALALAMSAATRPILTNALPACATGNGISTAVSSWSGRRAVLPGPRKKRSSGSRVSPSGPTSTTSAPSAIKAGAVSEAGEPLHRLPPTVPIACTWAVLNAAHASASAVYAFAHRRISRKIADGRQCADGQFVNVLPDALQLGQLADADDIGRLLPLHLHLHQQISAAGQDAGRVAVRHQEFDRFADRARLQIAELVHQDVGVGHVVHCVTRPGSKD